MKYITSNQFFDAEDKVRDSIMAWWKPSRFDLVSSWYGDDVIMNIYSENEIKCSWYFNQYREYREKGTLIPLLTIGQLIEYIEYKTGNLEIKITCVDAKNTLLDTLWEEAQRISR